MHGLPCITCCRLRAIWDVTIAQSLSVDRSIRRRLGLNVELLLRLKHNQYPPKLNSSNAFKMKSSMPEAVVILPEDIKY
eukprot:scaffold98516_cov22-Tisochrysis_lutea.AAC.3